LKIGIRYTVAVKPDRPRELFKYFLCNLLQTKGQYKAISNGKTLAIAIADTQNLCFMTNAYSDEKDGKYFLSMSILNFKFDFILTFVLHFISQSAIKQLKVKVNYNKKQHAIDTFNQDMKFISWEYRVHNPRGMYFDYEFYLFFIDCDYSLFSKSCRTILFWF
jgi:hypothetical protein